VSRDAIADEREQRHDDDHRGTRIAEAEERDRPRDVQCQLDDEHAYDLEALGVRG
jgi:hypothetical protein